MRKDWIKFMLVNQNIDDYNRETKEYIVAYIDILGMSNRILAMNKRLVLNKLHSLFICLIETTRQIDIKENKDIEFKIFSDNVLIAKKLSNEKIQRKQDIKSLLRCVRYFQELVTSDSIGWLLRGGISIGQLFIDNLVAWGDALLKSYYLESNIAKYPRIIIDINVINECIHDENFNEYIRKDFDGQFFLNFLCDCHFCGERLMKGFETMQKEINMKIDEKVYQNFCWHMNFVNAELDRKNEEYDKKYRLLMKENLKI